MKIFKKCAAQGDLLLIAIDTIPDTAIQEKPKNETYVLGHSETGHHHVVEAAPGVRYYKDSEDPLTAYLEVIDEVEHKLEHQKSFDTHESIKIPKGKFLVRRQRESAPNGWRKAID